MLGEKHINKKGWSSGSAFYFNPVRVSNPDRVEMDYLSNEEAAENFHKDSYRQEVAEKIKQAILAFGRSR